MAAPMPVKPTTHRPSRPTTPVHRLGQANRQARRALNTNSVAWKAIRARILVRDRYTCQAAGCYQAGNQVDHKDGDSSNNADDNLQCLCHSCHSAKTARENRGFGNG